MPVVSGYSPGVRLNKASGAVTQPLGEADMTHTTVNWFEIPVRDLNRAVEFYGTVLGAPLETIDGPNGPMPVFMGAEGPAGTLGQETIPVEGGVVIYLGCEDIDAALSRVEQAGGSVAMPRSPIGPFGFIGQFKDSEGNLVALHTPAD